MPRKIVVAVDQSEESKKLLEWAAKVVLKPEDHVVAIYCIPEKAMFGFGTFLLDEYWGRIQKEEVDQGEKILRSMRVEAEKIGIPITTETRPGAPHQVLEEYCTMIKADLLIMGRDTMQSVRGLGGSVSAHCIANCPCPVLVARAGTY
uniref:UspA domain-containing protein n=1 Tax=Rhodosorus marinus TaxID=101924 RepID=A0A7S3EJE5_9RHOD|mmetsp:Transcript_40792/g.161628  ORF Transcript_40792/g.161628 Transcript_40792/m.161628 type:complete len:148 (+) Transcript_40792:160-603(+)